MWNIKWHMQQIRTHKDVRVFKVVFPVWPNSSLTTNVPDIQFETRRLYTFDVETLNLYITKIRSHSTKACKFVCLMFCVSTLQVSCIQSPFEALMTPAWIVMDLKTFPISWYHGFKSVSTCWNLDYTFYVEIVIMAIKCRIQLCTNDRLTL